MSDTTPAEALAKAYVPKQVEKTWYQFWMKKGYFKASSQTKKKPYTIVIPPPNVTGILHMGHALNNTLQDIIIRYKRMNGFEALWMPGTDHAGIATQNVVEKQLAREGKEEYGDTIIHQLKKLGASCDWQRARFTMDEKYSYAVKHVFIELHKKG